MPGKLTKIVLAAVLICAGLPATGAEMPAYGTKNFTPGGDAPGYFTTNENSVVSAVAEAPAADDGADRAVVSPRYSAEPAHSAGTAARRHGKLASGHKVARRAAANSRARGHATHLAGARSSRPAAMGHPAKAIRVASRSSGAAKARTAKPYGAKPAKGGARHASAAPAGRKG